MTKRVKSHKNMAAHPSTWVGVGGQEKENNLKQLNLDLGDANEQYATR